MVRQTNELKRLSARLRNATTRAWIRRAFHTMRPRRQYEPVEIRGRVYAGKREAEDRWEAIAAAIRDYDAGSVLDVGCAEGWFLRRAAKEFGCFALGVETMDRRLLTGELARLHDGVERVAVMKAFLSARDIERLPVCDLVLCLSVVHHVLRHDGLPAAQEFLAALVRRAGKALLFEMGTSEEGAMSWAKALPDMPEGQEAFLKNLLTGAGAVNVTVVAGTPGLRKDAARLLLLAEPG